DRLSVLTRKQQHTRSAIIGAMIYPCLLVCVAVAVLTLMLTFVLPRFAGLFQTLDVPLPPTTKMLMALSQFLIGYWWVVLLGLGAAGVALKYWLRTDHGRRTLHTVAVRVPVAGPVVRNFAIARIVRVLGVLVNGRVPLLESLGLAK